MSGLALHLRRFYLFQPPGAVVKKCGRPHKCTIIVEKERVGAMGEQVQESVITISGMEFKFIGEEMYREYEF
jgi:hypothetical protein